MIDDRRLCQELNDIALFYGETYIYICTLDYLHTHSKTLGWTKFAKSLKFKKVFP